MAKKPKRRWIQKAKKRMKQKGTAGSFAAWCRRSGFKGATLACIQKGLRSKSAKRRKQANFARNVRR